MVDFIEAAILLPVLALLYQYYRYSVIKRGVAKQKSCQALGIAYCTLGIISLAFHSIAFVLAGLLLLMFGLRLIAHSLDRIDKKIFIDRYDDQK